MKDNGIVQGSKEWAVPLRIEKTTVYVHTDIRKVEIPEDCPEEEITKYDDLWEYNEIQYTKDEYLQIMSDKVREIDEERLYEIESYTSDLLYQICLLQLGIDDM